VHIPFLTGSTGLTGATGKPKKELGKKTEKRHEGSRIDSG
jgi:hypothetical protein